MTTTEESVYHDHDYCGSKVQEEKDIDFVVEKLLNSSSPKSMDAEIDKMDSLGLSPAYSCDSGIDSFANDLAQSLGGEDDVFLNLLLDGGLEFESELKKADLNFTGNSNNNALKSVKAEKASPKMPVKAPVGKKATDNNDEYERSKKNAENARENRRKKKLYIEGLEKEVGQLRNEKNVLLEKSNRLEKKADELQTEVDYLKSILANQSMLSTLIGNVSKTPGISLSTSFCSSRKLKGNNGDCEKENTVSTRSRKRAQDSQPATNAKRARGSAAESGGGICLHVKQSKVSLEFCQHCSKMAQD